MGFGRLTLKRLCIMFDAKGNGVACGKKDWPQRLKDTKDYSFGIIEV